MADYSDLMQIAADTGFQLRVQYAMESAAVNVMAEQNTVIGHALRVAYAEKILANSLPLFPMALAILTNTTIAAEADFTKQNVVPTFGIPDSDMQFAANSVFSALAGVAN
jgi:hypothetical protein